MCAKSQDDLLVNKCKYEKGQLKGMEKVLMLPAGDFPPPPVSIILSTM